MSRVSNEKVKLFAENFAFFLFFVRSQINAKILEFRSLAKNVELSEHRIPKVYTFFHFIHFRGKKCEILRQSLGKAIENFRIFSRKVLFTGNPSCEFDVICCGGERICFLLKTLCIKYAFSKITAI